MHLYIIKCTCPLLLVNFHGVQCKFYLLTFVVAALTGIKVVPNALQDGNERQGLGADQIGRVTNQPQPEEMLNNHVSQFNRSGNDEVKIFSAIRSLRQILVGFQQVVRRVDKADERVGNGGKEDEAKRAAEFLGSSAGDAKLALIIPDDSCIG